MNEYQLYTETDECLTKGICNLNPTLSSIQELILLYIKELAFYLLMLKDLGVTNNEIKITIVDAFYNIVTNVEYNQEEFHDLIVKLYNYINQSKFLYEKICNERDIQIKTRKSYFKYGKNFDLTDAIRKGEKYFLKKSQSFTQRQKDLFDIVVFLSKSIEIKIIEQKRLGKEYDDAYYSLLQLLNSVTPGTFYEENVKNEIEKAIHVYYEISRQVFDTQLELYGKTSVVDVSFVPVTGKAILVSGSDLKKLEQVLNAVENTEIKVYTHGLEMLMAHAFPKLRNHPNLVGHFGSSLDSSLIDFASFPGAILMTKATLQKVEYLYRGRLFTLDPIAPPGVIVIKDYNFEPLVKSALDAKGFGLIKTQQKPPIKVGYSEEMIKEKVDEIVSKIKTKEIRHLFIIGLLNLPNISYIEYFKTFFSILPDNCYAVSLCCPIKKANVFHLDSFFDYSLIYKFLKELSEKISIKDFDISIFLTRCDKHTISNLLYFKNVGIKNVYTCKCPSTILNPALVQTLLEVFNVKEMTTPQKDIEDAMK